METAFAKSTGLEFTIILSGNPLKSVDPLDDPSTLFNIAIKERELKPKIVVTYERKAFIFDAGNVRIFPYILEVKYDEFLPGFITQLLETGNMRQTSYSKYRLCREKYTKGAL